MLVDAVIASAAALCLWSAKAVYDTATRVYRGIPLALFPQVGRGVRQRLLLASALIAWLVLRIWG